MKRIIIALTLLMTTQGFAEDITAVVSNVVVAYQSDTARYGYTGRAGEIVRNTQNEGLTVFDGSTVGGISISRPMDFYVTSPEGGDVDEGLMGEKLKAVVALANNWATNTYPAGVNYHPARVIVDAGRYEVTNGLDVAVGVQLIARVLTGSGVGGNSVNYESGEPFSNFIGPWPSVILSPIGTNSIVRIQDYGQPANGISIRGIDLDGDLESNLPLDYSLSVTLDSSILRGSVFTNEIDSFYSVAANECTFSGPIFVNKTAFDGHYLDAHNCFFNTNSTIHGLSLDGSNPKYLNLIWTNCRIGNPDFFQPALGGFTGVFPQFRNCIFNGGDGFMGSLPADYTFIGPFFDCIFLDTGGTWGGSLNNGTPGFALSTMRFFGCDGVSSNFVAANAGLSVQWCSDENETAIANQ